MVVDSPVQQGQPPIDIALEDWVRVLHILHEQVPQLEVWAFGSRAKRAAKAYSDLDLMLMTEQPLPIDHMAAIADAFATSDLPFRVDLVDWASISEGFRKIIQQDRVLVQGAGQV
jgi:type I restriction enzyme S subunit